MTKIKYQLAALFLVTIFSCGIPSIHPIYTEDERIINDEILGTWSSVRTNELKINYHYTIESDDPADVAEGIKMIDSLFNFEETEGTWTFERAANITGSYGEEDSYSANFEFNITAESMLPKNAVIKEKTLLPYYLLSYEYEDLGEHYKNSMIVNITEINGDTYMDFYPYGVKDENQRNRFASNFIHGHTFAKVTIEDNKLALYSFDREYITQLIKEKRIRIKHEIVSEDEIILTASTKELRAFIAQFGDDHELFEDAETLYLQ